MPLGDPSNPISLTHPPLPPSPSPPVSPSPPAFSIPGFVELREGREQVCCFWNEYDFTQWSYWPSFDHSTPIQTVVGECAQACMRTPRCTGIEVRMSESEDLNTMYTEYCGLWYDGACSEVGDAGWHSPCEWSTWALLSQLYAPFPPLPPSPPPSPPGPPRPPGAPPLSPDACECTSAGTEPPCHSGAANVTERCECGQWIPPPALAFCYVQAGVACTSAQPSQWREGAAFRVCTLSPPPAPL